LNRGGDEIGVVVDLLHFHAHRHGLFELGQHRLHSIGNLQGITAGELIHRQSHRGDALKIRSAHGIGLTTELHAAHIPQAHEPTFLSGADDHRLEFLNAAQTALQLHREGELLPLRRWFTTHLTSRHQTVLAGELVDYIGRSETESRELVGIQPEAERQFAIAEIGEITNPSHALDRVREVQIQKAADRLSAVGDRVGILTAEVVNQQD